MKSHSPKYGLALLLSTGTFVLACSTDPNTIDLASLRDRIDTHLEQGFHLERGKPSAADFPCTLLKDAEISTLMHTAPEVAPGFGEVRDETGKLWNEAVCHWYEQPGPAHIELSIRVDPTPSSKNCTPTGGTFSPGEPPFGGLEQCDGQLRVYVSGYHEQDESSMEALAQLTERRPLALVVMRRLTELQ